ncbi:MAG TPA: HD domain-containing protein, partial [Longimicrobium sp.]|nr:HD domain-containing protein [Longimicrobium sp.]
MPKRPSKQDNDLPFPDGDGSSDAAPNEEMAPPLNRGGHPILPPVSENRLAAVLGDDLDEPELTRNVELVLDREFFLPVHGFVELTAEEAQIVDHPAFQRLGSIYQLGQTHLVYRGATHTRLEHVLGTLYVADEMVTAINKNHSRLQRQERFQEESPLDEPISKVEQIFIRLSALLHDIGHLPAGHTLEDELHLLDKHDGIDRLTNVLNRNDWPGLPTETLRARIDRLYTPWVTNLGISASDLVVQIVAKPPREGQPPLPGTTPAIQLFRLEVCRDIVGNTICADLLDYLHRDWYHIGKQRYFDRRLLQYMEVRRDGKDIPQIVVSLGTRPKIRTDAVSAILNLLESRYELAESVLFHRTKCSAAAMLERGLQELALEQAEGKVRESWATTLEKLLMDQSDKGV